MNRRDHRAAFEAKRTPPDRVAVSEAERRELMAIVDHHNEEMRCGLDKVGAPWDRDEDGEVIS